MLRKIKELLFWQHDLVVEETYLQLLEIKKTDAEKSCISFALHFDKKEPLEEMIPALLKINHPKTINLQVSRLENDIVVSVHFLKSDLNQVHKLIHLIIKTESEIKNHGEEN